MAKGAGDSIKHAAAPAASLASDAAYATRKVGEGVKHVVEHSKLELSDVSHRVRVHSQSSMSDIVFLQFYTSVKVGKRPHQYV